MDKGGRLKGEKGGEKKQSYDFCLSSTYVDLQGNEI